MRTFTLLFLCGCLTLCLTNKSMAITQDNVFFDSSANHLYWSDKPGIQNKLSREMFLRLFPTAASFTKRFPGEDYNKALGAASN